MLPPNTQAHLTSRQRFDNNIASSRLPRPATAIRHSTNIDELLAFLHHEGVLPLLHLSKHLDPICSANPIAVNVDASNCHRLPGQRADATNPRLQRYCQPIPGLQLHAAVPMKINPRRPISATSCNAPEVVTSPSMSGDPSMRTHRGKAVRSTRSQHAPVPTRLPYPCDERDAKVSELLRQDSPYLRLLDPGELRSRSPVPAALRPGAAAAEIHRSRALPTNQYRARVDEGQGKHLQVPQEPWVRQTHHGRHSNGPDCGPNQNTLPTRFPRPKKITVNEQRPAHRSEATNKARSTRKATNLTQAEQRGDPRSLGHQDEGSPLGGSKVLEGVGHPPPRKLRHKKLARKVKQYLREHLLERFGRALQRAAERCVSDPTNSAARQRAYSYT